MYCTADTGMNNNNPTCDKILIFTRYTNQEFIKYKIN